MASEKKDSEVVEQTIVVLQQFGWATDAGYGGEETGFCLMGGISVAAYDLEWFRSHCLEIGEEDHYAQVLGFKDKNELFDWNDREATEEEVIKLLTDTAEQLKNEGR